MNEVSFSHAFWGEKNTGFDALNQNFKASLKNTNDFFDFLRELNTIEDNHRKLFLKLSKQVASYGSVGSYKPCWNLIYKIMEKNMTLTSSAYSNRSTLIKDVQKYIDELQKKHRQIKESEMATQEVVHAFQVANTQLQKAKYLYHTRYTEYERIRLNEVYSVKEKEKSETKLKKSQDDYKYSVEKYNNLRSQFVDKMRISCDHFQLAEYTHLERMCDFLNRYSDAWYTAQNSMLTLCSEFKTALFQLTPNKLLSMLVMARGTGSTEPLPAVFEDVEVAVSFEQPLCALEPQKNPHANDFGRHHRQNITKQSNLQIPEKTGKLKVLRAASALAVVGDLGDDQSSLNEVNLTHNTNEASNMILQRHKEPSWKTSLGEISTISGSTTTSSGRRIFEMASNVNIFTRRNRQNSMGLENSTNEISTVSNSSSSGLTFKWPNVRHRNRLSGKSSNSPTILPDAKPDSKDPCTDEDGYTIRPEHPWDSLEAPLAKNSQSDDSDIDVLSENTFKRIKVNIRPLEDPVLKDNFHDKPLHVVLPAPKTNCRKPSETHLQGHGSLKKGVLLKEAQSSPSFYASTEKEFPTKCAKDKSNFIAAPVISPPLLSKSGQEVTSISRPRPKTAMAKMVVSNHPLVNNSNIVNKQSNDNTSLFENIGSPISDKFDEIPPILPASSHTNIQSVTKAECSTNLIGQEHDWEAVFPSKSDNTNCLAMGNKQLALITPDSVSNSKNEIKDLSDRKHCIHPRPIPMIPVEMNPISPSLGILSSPPKTVSSSRDASANNWSMPIAIAITETWRAQFPDGGTCRFTGAKHSACLAKQSLTGQVTLAVSCDNLNYFTETKKATGLILQPLVLLFNNSQRMHSIEAPFSGFIVKNENVSNEMSKNSTSKCRVTIPGDLLYHLLIATNATASIDSEYTRLVLLTYFVNISELNPPINLCTFWRCETYFTDFRLEYNIQWPKDTNTDTDKLDKSCQDLRVTVIIDGEVTRMQSRPLGAWNMELGRASWNIPISSEQIANQGLIRAKFSLSNGPGRPQPVALQFCRDGGSLPSGVQLSIDGPGYCLTMCKYRLLGDRYFCDPPTYPQSPQSFPSF